MPNLPLSQPKARVRTNQPVSFRVGPFLAQHWPAVGTLIIGGVTAYSQVERMSKEQERQAQLVETLKDAITRISYRVDGHDRDIIQQQDFMKRSTDLMTDMRDKVIRIVDYVEEQKRKERMLSRSTN
jgi:hypothetical protein